MAIEQKLTAYVGGSKKYYVIYHKNCYDGFAAAWVCKEALTAQIASLDNFYAHTLTMFPCAYGDPLPEIEDDSKVYMVDFSFPRDVLEALAARTTLVVLDHHKTAQANCEGLDFCTFDMDRSGAGLTWDHFFPGERRPDLVAYVEDRDLWRFALPDSREVHAWISSFPMNFELWDQLDEAMETERFQGTKSIPTIGTAILRYANQKVEEVCQQVQLREVGGYENIPTINVPYSMGSDGCHKLLELYPDAPFAAYYLDRGDGEQQWGLRGRDTDDFDVSEVAKSLGGGGHKKASGFIKGKVSR